MQRYPLYILLVPLLFFILYRNPRPSRFVEPDSARHTYLVRVADYPLERAKTWRYEVDILSADSATPYIGERAYAYIHKDSVRTLPSMGDSIWLRVAWKQDSHLLYGYVQAWQIRGPACGADLSLRERLLIVRYRLIRHYRELGITGEALQTLSAISLGYKRELRRETRQNFQEAGAAHILAVSGLHVGIIYAILWFTLTLAGRYIPLREQRYRRILLHGVIVASLWLYALLTGLSASVVRSVTMISFVEIGILLRRPSVSLNSLAAAAILLLCFRPEDVYNVGFWLSFTAAASLILMMPTVKNYLLGIIFSSLAAWIGTLPIALYCFGQVGNYFLLTNSIVIPLSAVILWLSFLLLTIGWIPMIGSVLALPTRYAVEFLNLSVAWIRQLPGATTQVYCSFSMMLLLYAAIIMGILSIRRRLYWLIGVGLSLVIWCYLYLTI